MSEKLRVWRCDEQLSLVGLRKTGEFIMQRAFHIIVYSPIPICIVGSGILQFGASILWNSYEQLKPRRPEKLGERLEFNGYELIAVNCICHARGLHYLMWMTKSREGKPVFLSPSGVVLKEEDEHTIFCGPVGLTV